MAQYFFMSERTFLVFIDALNGVQFCQRKVRATLTSPCVGQAPAIAGDEPVRDTTGFSFSANTDGDSGEKETLWEYAQHLQEPTGIFHGDPAESLWQK